MFSTRHSCALTRGGHGRTGGRAGRRGGLCVEWRGRWRSFSGLWPRAALRLGSPRRYRLLLTRLLHPEGVGDGCRGRAGPSLRAGRRAPHSRPARMNERTEVRPSVLAPRVPCRPLSPALLNERALFCPVPKSMNFACVHSMRAFIVPGRSRDAPDLSPLFIHACWRRVRAARFTQRSANGRTGRHVLSGGEADSVNDSRGLTGVGPRGRRVRE